MISKSEIKMIRSLSERSGRGEHGLFVAEGAKMVAEAISSGFEVVKIFHTSGALNNVTASVVASSGAAFDNIPREEVSPAEMERISNMKTPPGILALLAIPKYEFDFTTPRRNLVLVLDGVQDPGNMGTIIRLADWFGIGDIVCSPGSAECYNPKVVQATMGSLFRVRVHYRPLVPFISEVLEYSTSERYGDTEDIGTIDVPLTQKTTIPVYGTVLDGENIYRTELSNNGLIVMGSESHGISPEVGEMLTGRLLIPSCPAATADPIGTCPAMSSNSATRESGSSKTIAQIGPESLNVATATAIVCSEFRRKQLGNIN